MLKSDLQPPQDGLNADPVLYGIAAGLAQLFPPVERPDAAHATGPDNARGDDPAKMRNAKICNAKTRNEG